LLELIFQNALIILILIVIGMFIILRLVMKKSKSIIKNNKEEIEHLKIRVEELERNK
jgi:preprotein translocase subunit YajC